MLARMVSALARQSKSHAQELLGHIAARKNDIARAFYDIGTSLRELHEKKLHGALGYDSFDAMLAAEGMMSGQYARRLIQVASAFDREQAQRLGAEKAYALVRYCARTKKDDDPVQYIMEGFPVAGGKRRPIDDVAVREIAETTRVAVLRQKGEHSASESARRAAAAGARKLHAKLKERMNGEVTVQHTFRRGHWWLEIVIPAEMATLIR